MGMERASHVARAARIRAEFEAFLKEDPTIGTNGSSTAAEQPFTTIERLKAYWTLNRIKDALACGSATAPATQDLHWIQDEYIRVFSILVLIEALAFVDGIIEWDNLSDRNLPFLPQQSSPHKWPLGADFERFYRAQWQFCVQDFNRQLLMKGANFEKDRILPFQVVKTLKNGASARTHQIKIARECNHLIDEKFPSGTVAKTDNYVLKTYYTDEASRYYASEVKAFKHLMKMRDKKYLKNMIIFYGCWRQGNTYNILLEYANLGNLDDYLKKTHPPTKSEDITQFWSRLFDTAEALQRIHELRQQEGEPLILQGIHQDIKPANILVVSGPSGGDYDVVFKIADLGLSHFVARTVNGEPAGAKDTFGTQMYSAPECCRLGGLQQSDITVTRFIDIWSLGCVFSEAAAWVVLGEHGREQYATLRTNEIKQDHSQLIPAGYGDCFHDGTDALRAVKQMHDRLLYERRVSDVIIEHVISLIANMIETCPESRYTAAQLLKNAKRIIQNARDGKYPPAFRSIDGVVVEPPAPTNPHPHSSTYSAESSNRHRARNGSVPPPQSSPPTATSSPRMSMQRQTPPQTPSQLPGRIPRRHSHNRKSASGAMGNPINLPEAANGGLNILRSPTLGEHPTMSGAIDHQPSSRELGRSWSSRVSFAPGISSDSNLRLQGYPEEDERDENADDSFETMSRDAARPVEYVQNPNGIVSIREHPTGLRTERNNRKMAEYPVVSIDQALTWHKSSITTRGSSDPIEGFLETLQGRDHVFIIDDSDSMRPTWENVLRVFRALAGIVKHADHDGLDVVFARSLKTINGKRRKELIPMIATKGLAGNCNMKEALQHVFDEFVRKFDAPQEKRRNRLSISLRSPTNSVPADSKRGLSIYVLTDGVWGDGPGQVCGVEEPIRHIVSWLRKNQHLDTKVGIQFVRFGNDSIGEERLDILDSRLNEVAPDIDMDIVDTTKYDGNVLKMLLGAIDRSWDGEEQPFARIASHHSSMQRNSIIQQNSRQMDFQG